MPELSPATSSRATVPISTLSILHNTTMPKQKPEKVCQSVDEIATPDKAVEPAPIVRDDMPGDFMAFVRKALNAVNAKLDTR